MISFSEVSRHDFAKLLQADAGKSWTGQHYVTAQFHGAGAGQYWQGVKDKALIFYATQIGCAFSTRPLSPELAASIRKLKGCRWLCTVHDAAATPLLPLWHEEVLMQHQKQVPAPAASGSLQIAQADDRPWLTAWVEQMAQDVADPTSSAEARKLVDFAVRSRRLFLWLDGEPKAMAMQTHVYDRCAQIGYVFVPEHLRGQGWSQACVHATRVLLQKTHPVSVLGVNSQHTGTMRLYQSLGYDECQRFQWWEVAK